MLLTDKLVIDLIIAVVTLSIAVYFYLRHKYNYWKRKGVPQLNPKFPSGDLPTYLPKGIGIGAVTLPLYKELKKKGLKYGGVYVGIDPYLLVVDANLAKNILIKDFNHFVNRGIFHDKKNPITVNLFSQDEEDWRLARTKFTSIYTSAKMRFYFDTIKKCGKELIANLNKMAENNKDVDIYETMACYFTDVIGSVTYGIEANSFKYPDAIMRKMGRDLFGTFSLSFRMRLYIVILYPKLARLLGFGTIQPHIKNFIQNFVPEALEERQKNGIYRADFLQLLIELQKSGVNLTKDDVISQSFLFFLAGFETSSGASMFLLYELCLNRDIQNRVRNEINEVAAKYNGELTYDSLNEMKYFDQVFQETLRKYPAVATLNRVCSKDYKIPDTDVVIEKGTGILLPALGYHHDPELFPNPEVFDPDRFEDDSGKLGYFPFGDGPRNCIGGRLGKLQVKLGVAEVIRNFDLSLNPNEPPVDLDICCFVAKSKEPLYLRLKKIQ